MRRTSSIVWGCDSEECPERIELCGAGGCNEVSQNLLPAVPFTGTLPFTIPVPEPIHVGVAP